MIPTAIRYRNVRKVYCLLFCLSGVFAEQKSEAQIKDPFPYKFSASIYEEAKTNIPRWHGGVNASDLSFIGLYEKALSDFDSAMSRQDQKYNHLNVDSILNNYAIVDARNYILEKASTKKIIIINEAHYNPRHRVFVASLLKGLKKSGYHYFAAETFNNRNDSLFKINIAYPTMNAGYYTLEPQFANLIREANKLHFHMFPYEDTARVNGRPVNGRLREIGEAKNIASLFQKDPNAKIIIYCGHAHIYEDSSTNWGKYMAGRVREYTNIDPLTIDQIEYSEHSTEEYNNPIYTKISTKIKSYSILIDRKGAPFNILPNRKKVDMALFSPPTIFLHNRPGWIFENGKAPLFLNPDKIKQPYPIIIMVYHSEGDINKLVVPIDLLEVASKEELMKTALAVFPKKSYVLQIVDQEGNKQLLKIDSF